MAAPRIGATQNNHNWLIAPEPANRATAVERAIALSHEKYCSASIMLGKTAAITTSFEMVEA